MLYLLDSADLTFLAHSIEYYPIAGVTTNPSIVAREGRPFQDLIQRIRQLIGDKLDLHVQMVSSTTEGMVREARALSQYAGENVWAKIPVSLEGIRAIKRLKSEGIRVTATAIFTTQQALMAAVAGADYLAPYVDRIDNLGSDGAEVVSDIVRLLSVHHLSAKVLAASFKNVDQVTRVALAGAHAATIGPDLFPKLISHPMTDVSLERFTNDWEKVYGVDATTLPDEILSRS